MDDARGCLRGIIRVRHCVDVAYLPAAGATAGVPPHGGGGGFSDAEKAVVEAFDFLRSNGHRAGGVDAPTLQALCNLAVNPMPKGKLTPVNKNTALEDAMDWLRNNSPTSDAADDPTLQALATLACIPFPRSQLGLPHKKKFGEESMT